MDSSNVMDSTQMDATQMTQLTEQGLTGSTSMATATASTQQTYAIAGINVVFPTKAYPSQISMMNQVRV